MTRTVLITRPLTATARLDAMLRGCGYRTLIEPMLTIVPTESARPEVPSIDAVMLTSANACTALEAQHANTRDLLTKPCFCVGPHTASAAEALGFRHIISGEGSGADLARLILTQHFSDKTEPQGWSIRSAHAGRILHICGEDIAPAAHDELRTAGYAVTVWPVYRAEPATAFSPVLLEYLGRGLLDAALFFSPRTAAVFVDLAARHELQACCGGLTAIGLSEAVIAAARPIAWRQLAAAETPTEDAVVACLQRTCPVS